MHRRRPRRSVNDNKGRVDTPELEGVTLVIHQPQIDTYNNNNNNIHSNRSSRRLRPLVYLLTILVILIKVNYHTLKHIQLFGNEESRRKREFPGVEERVKLYMSSWYLPYCPTVNTNHAHLPILQQRYRTLLLGGKNRSYTVLEVTKDDLAVNFSGYAKNFEPLLLRREVLQDCRLTGEQILQQENRHLDSGLLLHDRKIVITYCLDSYDLVNDMEKIDQSLLDPFRTTETPLLSQWGDKLPSSEIVANIPMMCKWRPRLNRAQVEALTSGRSCWPHTEPRTILNSPTPILWKMVSARHFWPVSEVPENDVDWSEKKNLAVWRGTFTGIGNADAQDNLHGYSSAADDPLTRCRANLRCNFVYQWATSKVIDAGFDETLNYIPNVLQGVTLTKPKLNLTEMLEFKIIVSLEGNDVASGFKWSLYSNSVVLAPIPTKTTYAMEELLEPWIHYVPLKRDGSDAEDMVQWVLKHERKARRIAQRGKQWMYDLLFHPQGKADNEMVKHEILQRYRRLWHSY